jgi:transposase
MTMSTLAEPAPKVTGGVDTHRDAHVAAVIDHTGRQLGTAEFPTTPTGCRQLAAWIETFGQIDTVGVEGTGAWGAGLARHLNEAGVTVVEVDRPNRQHRRRHGKSDPADALAAARAALNGEATSIPKTKTGPVECIRVLRVARTSAVKARSQAANQLHSLLVTAPSELRDRFRGVPAAQIALSAAAFRPSRDLDDVTTATKFALREIARRWTALDDEITRLDAHLDQLVTATAPDLVDRPGLGTDTAGALLVAAGDNPERLRTEAAFAALCGASPIDASSGQQRRHRLNRGGNRTANQALWRIALVRMRHCPHTRAYVQRRTQEGLSKKEIIR